MQNQPILKKAQYGVLLRGEKVTYKITPTDYGFRLLFGDYMSDTDAALWCDEWEAIMKNSPETFGVFVDMRTLQPLSPGGQKSFEVGQRIARDAGMIRSVVILANITLTYQFKRIALQSGIYDWERYIDESSQPDWEQKGLEWVINGIDPDANLREQIARRRDKGVDTGAINLKRS
jgi:hypothetical protein